MNNLADQFDSEIITDHKIDLKKPKPYRVVLYNDHFTTMEFVVFILETIFHHPKDTAQRIMLDVHNKGKGIAGTYTRDIAETKAFQTRMMAKQYNYPLKCVAEPA